MSSRLTGKPSKKDRPKSSDKLRKGRKDGGTPEKPSTPNASEVEEDIPPPVLVNDEILALQIKPEDLAQLREPHPPAERKTSPKSTSVGVRKLKPAAEWDIPQSKTITIAKPAPPDAPLAPQDYSFGAGPRFTEEGEVVAHSILGSVEDYKATAKEMGDLPEELTEPRPDSQQGRLSVKYEKQKQQETRGYPKFEGVHESNALLNWQAKMMERKKQQGYLARLLNKPEQQLVMNQADSYRKTQELRYMIDRTIAAVDDGKGYRIGSEFWKQQEQIGDDILGVHVTLSQTEKGYPPPIEHVHVPDAIKKEKGTLYMSPRSPFHKPWHRTPYLAQRVAQLKPIMQELDPHDADAGQLAVTGSNQAWDGRRPWTGSSNTRPSTAQPISQHISRPDSPPEEGLMQSQQSLDPLADHPDVHPAPVFGPSIQFAGLPARWTGDSTSFGGQVGIEARVTFEAFAGKRTTSYLEITNDGTTSIYYDWRKIPKVNPFDMANPKTQRFYFNTSHGVILPGDKMNFPFVFKSLIAGVFSEQWQFETSPVVCGGAALVVTLRGVALQEDKYRPHRSKLESELARRQAEQIVSGIIDDLLEGIQAPERPCSPVDAHITEQEIFARINTTLHYNTETILKLKECYLEQFPEEEREEAPEWDMSVDNLKQLVLHQQFPGPQEEEDADEAENNFYNRKQGQLQFINQCVQNMSFPQFEPRQEQMYLAGYDILCNMVDKIVGAGTDLRANMGMPDREDTPPEAGEANGVCYYASSRHKSGKFSHVITAVKAFPASTCRSGEGKRGKGKAEGKAETKKGGKEAKGGKGGKDKDKDKDGAAKPSKSGTAGSKSRAISREKADKVQSPPASSPPSPVLPVTDPVTIAKYKEKLYAQAYTMVHNAMSDLTDIFSGVDVAEGGPRLPSM